MRLYRSAIYRFYYSNIDGRLAEAILAVADGTVVTAVDGIPETEMPRPGESREEFANRVLRQMWIDDPTGE